MAHRNLDMRVWGDAKFLSLSPPPPSAQWLWFYLLLGPVTTSLPGLIRVGEAALAESLGWSLERFRERFLELSRNGMAKADWKARVVWIPNAINYNMPANPNVVKGWKIHWDMIPECSLKAEAYEVFKAKICCGKPFAEAFDKCFGNGSGNGLPNGMPNQKQKQKQEQYQEQEQNLEAAAPPGGVAAAFAELVEKWNKIEGVIQGKGATKKRLAAFKERSKDSFWRENVQAALGRVAASSFCRGCGDKGWRADLDWFLRPESVVRIVEGKYDDRPGAAANGTRGGLPISEGVEDFLNAHGTNQRHPGDRKQ